MTRIYHAVTFTLMVLIASSVFFTGNSWAGNSLLAPVSEDAFRDVRNNQMWQIHKSKKLRSVDAVQNYLAELNRGKYHDWRLPTKQELYDLFSYFDLKLHGDVRIQLEGNYWLDNDGIVAGAWEIGDQCGPSRSFYSKKSGYVRAIRP